MSARHHIRSIMVARAMIAATACTEQDPAGPDVTDTSLAALRAAPAQYHRALAEMRRATARYHDVDVALAEGYIPVGECEVEEGEAPGGIPYANLDYLLDGQIDPARPDALLYEPGEDGALTLVGAELAVPFPLWTEADPPEFFGNVFRSEEEMGVYGLHVWLWQPNPDGLFAWGNPRVSCEEET